MIIKLFRKFKPLGAIAQCKPVDVLILNALSCSPSSIFPVLSYVLEQVSNVTLGEKNWITSVSASQK